MIFNSARLWLDSTVRCRYVRNTEVPDTETRLGPIVLTIKFRDIVRATMSCECGNEGWIGIQPQGLDYHVVVPVDVQIARGVMACNRPADGTPFGGYTDWIYFRCPPHEIDDLDNPDPRIAQALKTATELTSFLARKGIRAQLAMDRHGIKEDLSYPTCPGISQLPRMSGQNTVDPSPSDDGLLQTCSMISEGTLDQDNHGTVNVQRPRLFESICCIGCGKSWQGISDFLRDPQLEVIRYKACPEDFRSGIYVFNHQCGAAIELPVVRFARPSRVGKSLIGSHACPGLCYYENSLGACTAVCEGSCYRRIAFRIKSRRTGNVRL
jgi:hypothetical protein